MTKRVLLSVRPRFARGLVAGTKTAEVRRRFPELDANTEIYVYSSSPDRAVIGVVTLSEISRIAPADVWRQFSTEIEIDETDLDDYLAGVDYAAIIRVEGAVSWDRWVPLQQLRSLGLEPAQSYRYLTAEQATALADHSVISVLPALVAS